MILKTSSILLAIVSWIMGMLFVSEASTPIFYHKWLTVADLFLQLGYMLAVVASFLVLISAKETKVFYLILISLRLSIAFMLVPMAIDVSEIMLNYQAQFIPCIASVAIGIAIDIWGMIWWHKNRA